MALKRKVGFVTAVLLAATASAQITVYPYSKRLEVYAELAATEVLSMANQDVLSVKFDSLKKFTSITQSKEN